jgi:hypothetical protein
VAVSEDVQNCADEGIQIFGGMGFWRHPMESVRRWVSLVSMKVPTKSTECFHKLIKKKQWKVMLIY